MHTEEINSWLNCLEPDLAEGVALYTCHGRNRQLKKIFSRRAPSSWLRNKLRYELGKLCGRNTVMESHQLHQLHPADQAAPAACSSDVQMQESQAVPPQGADLAIPDEERWPDDLAPDADELVRRKRRLFSERAKLSNSLRGFAIGDDDGRKEVVDQIKGLTRLMSDIRLEQRGEKPEPRIATVISAAELPAEIGELYKARHNARASRGKLRTKLSKAEPGTENFGRLKARLEAWEERIAEIERRLA